MLGWAKQFSIFCYLEGNEFAGSDRFPSVMAAGCRRSVSMQGEKPFGRLRAFHESSPSWLFGHFGFELMQVTEKVKPSAAPLIDFSPGFFFEPEILIFVEQDKVRIEGYAFPEQVFGSIQSIRESEVFPGGSPLSPVLPLPLISHHDYLQTIKHLKEHIQQGDCYEINYCHPFYSGEWKGDPELLFLKLMQTSPNPFSALYKLDDCYCICASPERFLKISGNRIVSSPMKGTAPRFRDSAKDDNSRKALAESEKDRTENVMIVDLVRNDLSKCSAEGSVKVSELYAVHSFPHVHQMISTVESIKREDVHWTEVVRACFPMGSMTGAPKKRVLELISQYEPHGRGLYSGSIGCVDPTGNADLNVVIRSIFTDQKNERLCIWAGGGITIQSEPEAEYEESLLKSGAMIRLFAES